MISEPTIAVEFQVNSVENREIIFGNSDPAGESSSTEVAVTSTCLTEGLSAEDDDIIVNTMEEQDVEVVIAGCRYLFEYVPYCAELDEDDSFVKSHVGEADLGGSLTQCTSE